MAGSKIGQKLTVILAAAICVAGVPVAAARQAGAQTERVSSTAGANRQLGFSIGDIIYKQDDNVTRVCGHLDGRPHTSGRIDGVTLQLPELRLDANDIDGVDFERYFQWEDNGEIYIEIDFPMALSPRIIQDGIIIFHTAKGDVTVPVSAK